MQSFMNATMNELGIESTPFFLCDYERSVHPC